MPFVHPLRRPFAALFLLASLGCGGSVAGQAADLTKAPSFRAREVAPNIEGLKHWALLVGISSYDAPAGMDDLRFPRADVEALEAILTDPARGTYHDKAVTVITEDPASGKVTTGRLLTAVQDFSRRARQWEAESVLFFFSGHGLAVDGEAYLLPADAVTSSPDLIKRTALSYAEIERLLAETGARQQIAVLDACRNLATGPGVTKSGQASSVARASEWLQAVSSIGSGSGQALLTAASQGQVAYEDEDCGHGLLACKLLAALRGEADGAGGGQLDGRIDLEETFAFVKREVMLRSQELRAQSGGSRGVGLTQQIPQLVGEFDGQFILGTIPWGVLELSATPWAHVSLLDAGGSELALEGLDIEPYTPLRLRVSEGRYRVRFEYRGRVHEEAVTVSADEASVVAWDAAADGAGRR